MSIAFLLLLLTYSISSYNSHVMQFHENRKIIDISEIIYVYMRERNHTVYICVCNIHIHIRIIHLYIYRNYLIIILNHVQNCIGQHRVVV